MPGADATPLAARTTLEVTPATLLVVALGSCEQHGPHLPLGTDTLIAEAIAARVVDAMGAAAVLGPTIGIGASGEHAGFDGTLSIGTEALALVLIELVRSATAPGGGPFSALMTVNGHGGNAEALRSAAGVLRSEGRPFLGWSWSVPGADWHAGRSETSMVLALRPDLVRTDRAVAGETGTGPDVAEALRTIGVRGVSPSGVLGDPAGASAEEGRRLLAIVTGQAIAAARRLIA